MEICPCFYFELDPEAETDLPMCTCGHYGDEHDDDGDCQAEVENG